MKKIILTSAMIGSVYGLGHSFAIDCAKEFTKELPIARTLSFKPLEPTFIDKSLANSWKEGWFLSVQGGANAFVGSPLGCGDLFSRTKPTLQLALGKWYTESIANRLSFQGFDWTAGDMRLQKFRHWHVDFMYNLSPAFGFGNGNSRFDIIPLVGIGFIDNHTIKRHPFAVNYGLQGRFKLNDNWHITAEFGHAITGKDADGYGHHRQIGDNLLSLTGGITWTIGGKDTAKRPIDARPYMIQNEELMALVFAQKQRINQLNSEIEACSTINSELRKILEIEGLMERYIDSLTLLSKDINGGKAYAFTTDMNDYSGLNSLRKRLEEQSGGRGKSNGNKPYSNLTDKALDLQQNWLGNDNLIYSADYWDAIASGKECIGAPIHFFFHLGTTDLVDQSQTINIAEIARVVNKYDLHVVIEGTADSATGNEEINFGLGNDRAHYIAQALANLGVPIKRCHEFGIGGISTYSPIESNRNATVKLYFNFDGR